MKTAKENRIKNQESRIKNGFVSYSKFIIHNSKFCAKGAGFTLVEILVAATILATLVGGVLLTLNPARQINKALDAKRQADLQSIKVALDTYYNDAKCYPQQVPFGQEWKVNSTIYMKMVPQDTKCNNGASGGSCYAYKTDAASACPQWNVLFAKLSNASSLANTCPLSSLSSCTPAGYSDAVWACTLSGAVNCSALASSSSLGGGIGTPVPTNIPGPTATPTPFPTGSVTYNIGAPASTNPYIYQATIIPLYQTIGKAQSIQVLANDLAGNITTMQVILYSDGDARQFTLSRSAGTATSGTWSGTWAVTDTYNLHYGYDIIGTDDKGNTATGRIRVRN
jgi:type II secretory pathway pseudopilin PulG